MKPSKDVVIKVQKTLHIKMVTLLSLSRYIQYKDRIPKYDMMWWLRSPGTNKSMACCVCSDFAYYDFEVWKPASVRPVLVFNERTLNIEDKFELSGYFWTVIEKGLAICDTGIDWSPFRNDEEAEDANKYSNSDVRDFLLDWASDHHIIS